jgi:LemA protein
MKRSSIILLSVIALLVIFVAGAVSQYNKLIGLDEGVNAQWANVENQYQRRADLIPNLVATVKGYASHERETLEGVIEARSKATQVTIDPSNMTQSQLNQFQAAQGELSSALSRLMVVVERYPDLKANQNFRDLQIQLEGTENRIANERTQYNSKANSFNSTVRRFPANMIAGMFGFERKAYFEAEKGSEQAPTVEF